MKQYCRYCIHLHTPNGIWCDAKQKELSESSTKTVNNCKLFEFCEMDAYFENNNRYKPRERKRQQTDNDMIGQMIMEVTP